MSTDQFDVALERSVDLFTSGAEKVMRHNPSWVEFFALLSEEEQRVFFAFVARMSPSGGATPEVES